jgi:peptidyl-prolyl cis-trans isomerase C
MATRVIDVLGSRREDRGTEASSSRHRPEWLGLFRRGIRWVAREPFFQFIALGSLLFAASQYLDQRSSVPRISVGPREVEGIKVNYRLQYGASPSDEQLKSLTDRYIEEEIFYREALRLKLDENDEIVRRRLVQKYEFLQQDLASPTPPTENELRAYYAEHRGAYEIPERLSFSQVFFSVDRAGDAEARARAGRALAVLRRSHATRAPELGDSFPGETDYIASTPTQIRRAFGSSEFTDQIVNLPSGGWSEPLRSGLGWHLVYVEAVEAAGLAPFEDVRDRVERDYLEASRASHEAQAYARLKQHYRIDRTP